MRFLRNNSMAIRTQAAFTLVEIVVAVGLLSLLISLLFMILSTSQATVDDSSRAADIHANASAALELFRDELLRSKPPRSDVDKYARGQMFVIKNNANGVGDDELWYTTGAGYDVMGRPIRKNVRYYVEMDPNVHLKVLKRQEFVDLTANPAQAPISTEENSATICQYVDHFDVQYLSFNLRDNKGFPDKFLPDIGDDTPKELNFRVFAQIWNGSGLPANQTSPPAVRITLVVRERLTRQNYFFQQVFLVPMNTYDPNTEEAPPP